MNVKWHERRYTCPMCRGARFAKLKVRYDAENALDKYEPFIVVSKNFP